MISGPAMMYRNEGGVHYSYGQRPVAKAAGGRPGRQHQQPMGLNVTSYSGNGAAANGAGAKGGSGGDRGSQQGSPPAKDRDKLDEFVHMFLSGGGAGSGGGAAAGVRASHPPASHGAHKPSSRDAGSHGHGHSHGHSGRRRTSSSQMARPGPLQPLDMHDENGPEAGGKAGGNPSSRNGRPADDDDVLQPVSRAAVMHPAGRLSRGHHDGEAAPAAASHAAPNAASAPPQPEAHGSHGHDAHGHGHSQHAHAHHAHAHAHAHVSHGHGHGPSHGRRRSSHHGSGADDGAHAHANGGSGFKPLIHIDLPPDGELPAPHDSPPGAWQLPVIASKHAQAHPHSDRSPAGRTYHAVPYNLTGAGGMPTLSAEPSAETVPAARLPAIPPLHHALSANDGRVTPRSMGDTPRSRSALDDDRQHSSRGPANVRWAADGEPGRARPASDHGASGSPPNASNSGGKPRQSRLAPGGGAGAPAGSPPTVGTPPSGEGRSGAATPPGGIPTLKSRLTNAAVLPSAHPDAEDGDGGEEGEGGDAFEPLHEHPLPPHHHIHPKRPPALRKPAPRRDITFTTVAEPHMW